MNVLTLVYGLYGVWLLAQPAGSSNFISRWAVLFDLAIVIGSGLIYMSLTRPFDRSTTPENDTTAYASKLDMGRDN